MPPEQMGDDAEKPGPGILPVKVVGFEWVQASRKVWGVGREVPGPSGHVTGGDSERPGFNCVPACSGTQTG